MILDQTDPVEKQQCGELCLLVDADLKLRLNMQHNLEDSSGSWSVAGVSFCRAGDWMPLFTDCAGAVRFSKAETDRAYEGRCSVRSWTHWMSGT